MSWQLKPYGGNEATSAIGIEIEVSRPGNQILELRYTVRGPIDALIVPQRTTSGRADNLWQTTCFELFLGEQGEAYREVNFSPSGEWAAYAFNSYRAGMREAPANVAIDVECDHQVLTLTAKLSINLNAVTSLGLTAIIEEQGGRKSYWALAHPAIAPNSPPDFHDSSCFVARLPE